MQAVIVAVLTIFSQHLGGVVGNRVATFAPADSMVELGVLREVGYTHALLIQRTGFRLKST